METNNWFVNVTYTNGETLSNTHETVDAAEADAYNFGALRNIASVEVKDDQDNLIMSLNPETLMWERHALDTRFSIGQSRNDYVEFDLMERALEHYFGRGVLASLARNDKRLRTVPPVGSAPQGSKSAPLFSSGSVPREGSSPSLTGSVIDKPFPSTANSGYSASGYRGGSTAGYSGKGYTAPVASATGSIIPDQKKLLDKVAPDREKNPRPTITSTAREFAEHFPVYAEGIETLYEVLVKVREFAPDKKDFVRIIKSSYSSLGNKSFISYIAAKPGEYDAINTTLHAIFAGIARENGMNIVP